MTTLILTGVLAAKLAHWVKIPDVVLFLLAGMGIGPSMLKLVNLPADSVASQIILIFGSALILFDGGLSLDFQVLKKVWRTIVLLATLGVVVTTLITGLAARFLLGLPVLPALLLAAVIASTDPATLVPIFQQIKIRERVAQTVLSESAFNDATGAILTFSLLGALTTGAFSPGKSILMFLGMAGGGLLAGIVIGLLVAYLVAHHKVGILGPYSAVMVVLAVLAAYLTAGRIGGSGYMAVFVTGIILGNLPTFKLEHRDAYATEQHYVLINLSLVMRMLIFILLGTQVNFTVIGKYWLAGLLVIAVFMLVARPATVLVSALPDRVARWEKNELFFMFWTRETGVIPAALSGILIGMGAPHADVIAALTFIAILATLLIQAGTTGLVARKLGLLLEGAKTGGGR
ncbi:hypothetical protein A6M21_11650 [Desulfotomaculum copahuensis]|uniref:Cation/H+ exchanger transmembrane domain-containing protein n=2 Tax=Desulfotomaculum copahuensis TaxID=1838280 RepID=A0A1B7LDL6_9FIRM|nr:hypothetical protein A6M21_11650 [Desulfotomaculum copahuensis]